jgi:hypothetical protein
VPPIYIRAQVDGPFGSARRVRWNDYSTAVIICGGSGISFGASICDHICQLISRNATQTQRVRLCWVAREYAEIAWVAGQLYRCQQMVPADRLEISIFVTNASKIPTDFAPPQPGFARGVRRDSVESALSEMSMDLNLDETVETHGDMSSPTHYADVIDLTNYEDEEDVNDAAEQQLSDRLQQQGKVRRAKSRKAARGLGTGPRSAARSPLYPPRPQSNLAYDSDPYSQPDLQTRTPSRSYPDGLVAPRPGAGMISMDARRDSFRSIADSTYGRYDPFANTNGHFHSPSPSIMFDDNHSMAGESVHNLLSRASRTGSMVLLEDNGGDTTGDAALWIDQADFAAMYIMSEVAKPGKPKLASVLEEEIERATGSLIVASE